MNVNSTMTKFYLFTKKIHRLSVLIILAISLFMAGTGLLLRYPAISTDHLTFIDLGLIRYLHNRMSLYFAIVLAIMSLTGLWMFLYPWLMHRKQLRRPHDPTVNQQPPHL